MSERTHWEGCWRERTHHECAVARVEELERERDVARTGENLMIRNATEWKAVAEKAGADRDAALARAEKAEKDAERHLDLLRQARHYVADKRLNEDELGGRRRRETNQDAADRISMAMENNEVRANLLEAITAAIDAARAEG